MPDVHRAATSTPSSLEPGQMVLISDLPPAGADPHALARTRSGSTRSRTRTRSGSTRATPRGSGVAHRRPRARRDRDRPLRRQGVGDRGHPPRRRRVQPPHGPLEAGRQTGGQRQAMATVVARARRRATGRCSATRRRRAVRLGRSRHAADLVDRRRRPPEPHVPRASRSDLRACTAGTRRCACAGPSPATPTATSPSTPAKLARGLPAMARRETRPARAGLARRDAAPVLAAAPAQACAGRLPAAAVRDE